MRNNNLLINARDITIINAFHFGFVNLSNFHETYSKTYLLSFPVIE